MAKQRYFPTSEGQQIQWLKNYEQKFPALSPRRDPMIGLHPEFLKKDGKPEFAVLPYGEFVEIERTLAGARDLIDLREAKAAEGGTPGVGLEEARRRLGL